MNLKARVNKIAKILNAGEETMYIFVMPEDKGGSFTLYGEEGKKHWDATVSKDSIIKSSGDITVCLPYDLADA